MLECVLTFRRQRHFPYHKPKFKITELKFLASTLNLRSREYLKLFDNIVNLAKSNIYTRELESGTVTSDLKILWHNLEFGLILYNFDLTGAFTS